MFYYFIGDERVETGHKYRENEPQVLDIAQLFEIEPAINEDARQIAQNQYAGEFLNPAIIDGLLSEEHTIPIFGIPGESADDDRWFLNPEGKICL